MVRRGDFLERSVLIPLPPLHVREPSACATRVDGTLASEACVLEGLFHRGGFSPALLIVPPHPSGGSMDLPAIAEIAWAVTRAGHATLRFNYRGVGASSGAFDTGVAVEDARGALLHLRACSPPWEVSTVAPPQAGCGEVAMLGFGLGAEVAARVAVHDAQGVAVLVLVAPELGALPHELLKEYVRKVRIVIPEEHPAVERRGLAEFAGTIRDGALTILRGANRPFSTGSVELAQEVVASLESRPRRAEE